MTEFLTKAAEIAKAHGFSLQELGGGNTAFQKDAEDGSYWLATPVEEAEISETDPEADAWMLGRYKDTDESDASIVILEPLSLGVVLSEHERLPTPEFDKDGDGMAETLRTWADIRWRGRKAKPSWDKFVRILKEDAALTPVFEAGFVVTTTGGGCTAFELVDDDTETTFLMAVESTVLGHPQSKGWVVQRENEDGVVIGVSDTTLAEAVARFRDIPVPVADQEKGHWYLSGWDDFDANGPSASAAKP